jgi:hypothetical protein
LIANGALLRRTLWFNVGTLRNFRIKMLLASRRPTRRLFRSKQGKRQEAEDQFDAREDNEGDSKA